MRKGRSDYHANEVVTSLLFRDLWDEWFSGRTLEVSGSPCLTREKVQLQRRQLQRGQGSGPKIRSLQPALPVPFLDCFRPGWLTQLRQQDSKMYLRLLLTVFKHPYYLLYFFLLYSARLPSLSITSANLCLRSLSSPWQWPVLWLALSSKEASDSDLVWRSLPKFMNFLSNVHPIYV